MNRALKSPSFYRKRINILGLYSPDDHDIFTLEYPTNNADAVTDILKNSGWVNDGKLSDLPIQHVTKSFRMGIQ